MIRVSRTIDINYISVYDTNFSYSKNWTYPTLPIPTRAHRVEKMQAATRKTRKAKRRLS